MSSAALELSPQETQSAPELKIITGSARTQFTRENARAMALRAQEVLKAKKAKRLALLNAPEPEPLPADKYVEQRIARTRAQIEKLDTRLATCRDPKAIKFLADAIAKLAELERVLSGRPLPGQLRPSGPKPRKSGNLVQPLEDSPVPQ